MKTGNKILLWCLGFVAVAAISVAGTLAYLTDQDSVVNTFTVGKVQITLDETKVNSDGTVVEGAERVRENEYHLIQLYLIYIYQQQHKLSVLLIKLVLELNVTYYPLLL